MRATSKATRVPQALPVHRGRKGLPVQQDPEVLPAHRVHRGRKDPPVQQDPEVPKALLAHRAHRGRKGPPERVALHPVAATGCAFQMEHRSVGASSIQTEMIIHGHFRWHFLIRDILLLVTLAHSLWVVVRAKARHHAYYLDLKM